LPDVYGRSFMNKKKILQGLFLILIILFLSLYFSKYNNSFYENKKVLTEEAMLQYEKDLKEGKIVNSKEYLPEEKNYQNKASKIGMKLSEGIDKGFKQVFRYFIKYLDYIQKE